MISFDGTNKLITLDASQSVYTIQYIYSRWLDWVRIGNNSAIEAAFTQTGGNPIGNNTFVGVYFFLQNDKGWRIKPPEQDGDYVIVGNFYPVDSSTGFLNGTTGNYSTTIRLDSSQSSQVVEVGTSGGGNGLTLEQFIALKD